MFEYKFFLLTTKSYTHVGQGAAESAVIDSLIQREQPYNIPIIYASSLKGAIRDHYEFVLNKKDDSDFLFGSQEPDQVESNGKTIKTMYQALVNFFDARLLFLPVGALAKYSYYYATSPYILNRFTEMYKQITGINSPLCPLELELPSKIDTFIHYSEENDKLTPWIEGIQGNNIPKEKEFLDKELFGIKIKRIAIFNDELFLALCRDCIPVLEHNKLDDYGISENKFNEEVLPYDTKMWFFLSFPNILKNNDKIATLITELQAKYIQVGANASLGQGLCEIEEIKNDQ